MPLRTFIVFLVKKHKEGVSFNAKFLGTVVLSIIINSVYPAIQLLSETTVLPEWDFWRTQQQSVPLGRGHPHGLSDAEPSNTALIGEK